MLVGNVLAQAWIEEGEWENLLENFNLTGVPAFEQAHLIDLVQVT